MSNKVKNSLLGERPEYVVEGEILADGFRNRKTGKLVGSEDTYTKEQIDAMLAAIREGQYVEVNTTEYPTLEDFLESTGQQGTVYLYPVENEANNYYQYIWEVDEWKSLGSTEIDLSQYAKVTIIAPLYSTASTYSVGQKVIYNGKLYTCSTAITEAESWNAEHWTEITVSSGFVDLDSEQTIPGTKTFDNGIHITDHASTPHDWFIGNFGDNYYFTFLKLGTEILFYANPSGTLFTRKVRPIANNTFDIGDSSVKYREGFINKITDANGSYSSDNVFNVINASDIVSNTLTQDQYDLITNGKPTLIKGTWNGYLFNLITQVVDYDTTYYSILIERTNQYRQTFWTKAIVNKTTRVITFESNNFGLNYQGKPILINKTFPDYPTTNISRQFLSIAANGGSLSYENPFSPESVSISDGGTISDDTLKNLITGHYPIVLNGYTGYFSCDDGTNYQYANTMYDSSTNSIHYNVITINKSTWVVTFHVKNIAL